MPLKVADSFLTLVHAYVDTLMTYYVLTYMIMTHAINDSGHWHKSRSNKNVTTSTDHITRMTTYSDEKEPKRREREWERNEERQRE